MDTCKSVFQKDGQYVEMREIKTTEYTIPEADILGFCFPVYAFGIPRICRNYLRSIKKFSKKQKVFVLVTAGNEDESGFSVRECERILLINQ